MYLQLHNTTIITVTYVMCTQFHSSNNNNKNKNNSIDFIYIYIYAHFTIIIQQVVYPYTTSQQKFNSVCHKILSYNLVYLHMDTLSNNM
jgi:hypothetical protein